jgi:hypothetical protein
VTNPLEVRAHLALHLVDVLQRVEVLADDALRLVRVSVIADDFRGNHKRGDEEAVPT